MTDAERWGLLAYNADKQSRRLAHVAAYSQYRGPYKVLTGEKYDEMISELEEAKNRIDSVLTTLAGLDTEAVYDHTTYEKRRPGRPPKKSS